MIYKYEIACKEAGLSEEQTAEIRKFFDGEKKKLKRDKEKREKNGIVFNSLRGLVGNYDADEYEIEDPAPQVEKQILHKLELEQLRRSMDKLPEDDREFLYAIFENDSLPERKLAEKLGIPAATYFRRKKRVLEQLRKKFFEEN